MNKELIAKARGTKSAEELFALAKEEGIELTEDHAKELFDQFHSSDELSDEELDMVGGGCGSSDDDDEDHITINGKKWRIIHDPTQKCLPNRIFWPAKNQLVVGVLVSDKPAICANCAYLYATQRKGATVYYCYDVIGAEH